MQNLKDRAEAASEILRKFSVRYRQLWINEDLGTVFCLIQGPNRAICEAVHKSIYGVAFETVTPVKECLEAGEDSGYSDPTRTRHGYLLAVFDTSAHGVPGEMSETSVAGRVVRTVIESHDGVLIHSDDHQCRQAYFSPGVNALRCGAEIQSSLLSARFTRFRIAILANLVARDDVEKNLSATRAAHMQSISADSRLIVGSHLYDLALDLNLAGPQVHLLTAQDEIFLDLLFRIIDDNLHDDSFNVDSLSKKAGISRPQLYRKVHALTGRSPNSFIRDLRMEKALTLLRQRHKNICEIAFEVGYTNPSYFARTFSDKYGCTPSEFLIHTVV
jgi:AraC-like DNA-binding protein